jgi:tetratricopeptide (TPR) repeat protein
MALPESSSVSIATEPQLSGINKHKPPLFRWWLIFLMMALALLIYFILPVFFKHRAANNDGIQLIDIDTILLGVYNNTGVIKTGYGDIDSIPPAIKNFIGTDNSVRKKEGIKIVIYEIIEQPKKIDSTENIKLLLEEAKELFRIDRLTSPVVDNAFEKYKAVLAIDPDNVQAITGIQKIVDRYILLSEKVIKKNESYKVAGLIKSAYKVGSSYVDMSGVLAKYADYIKDDRVFFEKSTLKVDRVTDNSTVGNKTVDKGSLASVADADKKIAAVAVSLVKNNDISGAITILERFAVLSNYWDKSYDLLLDLYLKQYLLDEAEMIVSENKSLDIFQLSEKVARIFIARDDIAGAIALLDTYNPTITDYPNYYALKAGLYYKHKDYNKAINLYRRLLRFDYKNSVYWLGLAMSLSAVGDAGSIEAFHYSHDYADAESVVSHYIQQHIPQLAL